MEKSNFIIKESFNEFINEATTSWKKMMKAVRSSNTGPWSLVAIENYKVVAQKIDIRIADIIPANFEAMRKDYPRAKIHIEDGSGAVVWNESVITEAKFKAGQVWVFKHVDGDKNVEIIEIKSNGDVVAKEDGKSDKFIVRDANKFLKKKITESIDEAASIPSNILDFAKRKGSYATSLVKKAATWAEKAGKHISGGTAIGKDYMTIILDMKYQGSEIYISLNNETIELFGEEVTDAKSFAKVLSTNESVVTESHFKVGDKVKMSHGGTGVIVSLDKEDGTEDEKYYNVKLPNGDMHKHAPNELTKESLVTEAKELDRDAMMIHLEDKYKFSSVRTTEDFDGSQGGIWLSAENGESIAGKRIYNYYGEGSAYDLGVLKKYETAINKLGWYSEWYDAGTVMLWTL